MERIRVHSEHPHLPRRAQAWYRPEGLKPSHSGSSAARATRPAQCPPPRRSRTANGSQEHARARREGGEPWRHVAKTYAWVVEQEMAEMARQNEDTVRWVRRQQDKDRFRERAAFEAWGAGHGGFWGDGDDGLIDEEIAFTNRRRRAERSPYQQEMDRVIRDELHRLQAQRSETERCRAAYERRKAMEDEREKQRARRRDKEREAAEKAAWDAYESGWAKLASSESSSEPLTFNMVPWPLLSEPRNVEEIRSARVTMFVLSPHHSHGQTMKDRVRSALRRWHPDRFGRILARVKEEDRPQVEVGVGIVVRCLNDLLERAER